jgi:hypothetical protein
MALERNHELLEALGRCAAECNNCATACLHEEDVQMLSRCIRLNMDCADICRLTASFVARDSEHVNHLLRECAEICEACAEECEKHGHMEHCRTCAEACHHCADACLHLA